MKKKSMVFNIIIVLFLLLIVAMIFGNKKDSPLNPPRTLINNNKPSYGVSSSNSLAVDVGMNVLRNGGNAIDAAIAVSYALGVVEPYGSGIGGGGGMLIAKKDQKPTFIDYREMAPTSSQGKSSVPGFVAGMSYVHDKYGTKPMDELMQPAIDYAKKGFKVNNSLHSRLYNAIGRMDVKQLNNFYPKEEAISEGEILKQPQLTNTLVKIQHEDPKIFYKGEIAKDLVKHTSISLDDLERYEVKEREPVISSYHGNEIISAPPPFSGVTLIQMLKMADKKSITTESTSNYYEKMNDIKTIAYKDRLQEIGDPAFYKQHAEMLVSDKHIDQLIQGTEKEVNGAEDEEHESTTHFVVIDKDGTVVSTTNTLSNFFGIGKQVDGFFLNNNADTFGSKGINEREPGKRSRTFTAPTIMRAKGQWVMGVGSPGGTRIPQVLTQVLSEYMKDNKSLQEAVNQPRFIFDNDYIYVEPELETEDIPSSFHISIKESDVFYGGVQALKKDFQQNRMDGAGDPRREGIWKMDN